MGSLPEREGRGKGKRERGRGWGAAGGALGGGGLQEGAPRGLSPTAPLSIWSSVFCT
jgi:hypothetical protein